MPAFKGALVKVQQKASGGSTYETITGSRNVQIDINSTRIDTTSAEDIDVNGVTWASHINGMVDLGVQMSGGVIKDGAAFFTLSQAALEGTELELRVIVGDSFYMDGKATVTSNTINGPYDDVGGYDMTFTASGAWTSTAGVPA